jgi:hypothetical protein
MVVDVLTWQFHAAGLKCWSEKKDVEGNEEELS